MVLPVMTVAFELLPGVPFPPVCNQLWLFYICFCYLFIYFYVLFFVLRRST